MHLPTTAAIQGADRPRGLDRLLRAPRLSLVLLCLLLWLPGFAALPPTDRDEARFAVASRQMLETGDPVRIRFQAEERNKKPAGIHWLQAGAVLAAEALGVADRTDIWPYRVPSLLGGLLAVLATHHWGRALVGRRAALLGAAMLASSLVLVAEVRIAKTDAALLATVVASMGLLGAAYLRPGAFAARHAAAFWLLLGAGVLLKGPIGPMVPLLAGVTLALVDRQAPWWPRLRPLWGVPLMLAAAAPWFVAIGIATEGRFFADALGGDMLAKATSGEEKHGGPPGYYLATFGIAAFPGAWAVVLALPAAWAARTQPATRFLLAWVVPSWLVFEAVATKLPHYTLPLLPALLLLAATWVIDPLRSGPGRVARWLGVLALAGTAAGIAGAGVALAWFVGDTPTLIWGAVVVPAAALALAIGTLRAWRARAPGQAAWIGIGLAVPLYAAVLHGVLPGLTPAWIAPRLAAAVADVAPDLPAERLGVAGIAEPSLVFALGTGVRLLSGGVAAGRFLAEGEGPLAVVEARAEAGFHAGLAERAIAARRVGGVDGFNYSRGRPVQLGLWRLEARHP